MNASPLTTGRPNTRQTLLRGASRSMLLPALLCFAVLPGAGAAQQSQISGNDTFATVDDRVLTVEEYVITLRSAVRSAFYHGQIPDDEMAGFQRRVAGQMVDRLLFLAEAERRGLRVDPARYAAQLDSIETRYAGNVEFEANREAMLASLEQRLAENDLIEQLRADVQDVPVADEAALRAFHESNPDKFTEPERIRVSAILLKVDPSAPRASWDAAREEASRLRERLVAGADFADLARLHSSDKTARDGGDMGYLHRGMLGGPAQIALDELQPGQMTPPIDLLEGVALFRLDERQHARQNGFDTVRERAAELLRRQQAEQAWNDFENGLRERATVSVRQDLFLPESADAASVHGAGSAPTPESSQ